MKRPLIVVTRGREDAKEFIARLRSAGARPYSFPCIRIIKLKPKFPANLKFDYIIFTSTHAVTFFARYAKKLKGSKIVAVGTETKKALKNIGLKAEIVPENFTSKDILKKLKNISSKNILLPTSKIASKDLPAALKKKGAKVCTIYLYTTVSIKESDKKFNSLLQSGKINYMTFMSPSSVSGFKTRVKSSTLLKLAKSIPVVSIGPRTTATLKKEGFKKLFMADTHTIAGIVAKLKKLL